MNEAIQTAEKQDGRGKTKGSQDSLEYGKRLEREQTEERRNLFLQALDILWPNVGKAASQAGVTRTTVYTWRQTDEKLRKGWDEIQEKKLDLLEDSVFQTCLTRGGAGYAFPLLKAYRRDRYGDKLEHSGMVAHVSMQLPHGMPDKRSLRGTIPVEQSVLPGVNSDHADPNKVQAGGTSDETSPDQIHQKTERNDESSQGETD